MVHYSYPSIDVTKMPSDDGVCVRSELRRAGADYPLMMRITPRGKLGFSKNPRAKIAVGRLDDRNPERLRCMIKSAEIAQ
jgi:hypothetical protein